MQCATSLYVPGFDAEPAPTQPSLSVSGRTDGEAYTVTAGARSITITAAAGATLSTTVEQASDGSTVSVTDSTTTTPDWTAPSGSTTGEAVQVQVTATLDGLTSQVSWTERVAGSGGGGGGAAWTTLDTLAPADLANAGPFTTGTNNADYDGETIAVTTVRNGDSGDVEFIQNTGIVVTSVGGTITAGLYLNDRLLSWARAYSMFGPIAVHVPVDITFSATTDNGVVIGFNDRVTHNNGEFRGCRLRWKDASNEQFQVRTGSTDQDVGSTTTPNGTFVLTAILHAGVIVEVMRTSGTTPPTPTPGSGIAVTNGGDSVGAQATTIPFDDFYLIVNAVFSAVVTVGQLEIERWQ